MERLKSSVAWRGAQYAVLLAGGGLVISLFAKPALGLDLLWNGRIPLAPALLVVAPGLWRNLCPLATVSLLGRGERKGAEVTTGAAGALSLAGVLALVLVVPARHLILDRSGPGAALMLLSAAVAAVTMGRHFKGRGGWCTTLCPILPVARLYGVAPARTWENARCEKCVACARPCPDLAGPTPLEVSSGLGWWAARVMTGGFAGFIWGFFQVDDARAPVGLFEVVEAYLWPLAGAGVSLMFHAALSRFRSMDRLFAAGAVSTYYWYRLPALAGFGLFPDSGVLMDLTGVLPPWAPLASRIVTTAFFGWFLLVRTSPRRGWLERPGARVAVCRSLAAAA